jgi:hypothetical protein
MAVLLDGFVKVTFKRVTLAIGRIPVNVGDEK